MRAARALRAAAAALLTAGLLGTPAAHAASPGLVGAYGLEEAAGTVVTDSSGLGNAGTISGATRSTAGKFGAALSFDGVNDIVNIPDANSLDLSPAMTLEAWVRPTAGGWRTVLLKERPGGLAYALYASTDTNRPSSEIRTTASVEARGSAALPSNVWSHVATTFDGSSLRLFVNGAQVASRAASESITVSSGALRIGGNAIWGEYFKGLIDEVRVYNRALTPTEIQADRNAPVFSAAPDTTAPSAPGGFSITQINGVDGKLDWAAATDNVAVAGYRIHRSATTGFTPSAVNLVATAAGSATTYTDAGLEPGKVYYRVVAVDAAGNLGTPSVEGNVTSLGPQPPRPTDLTATTVGGNIRLDWQQPSFVYSVSYRIYRSTTDPTVNTGTVLAGTSIEPTFTDPLPPEGAIYYRVQVLSVHGATNFSDPIATSLGPDTTPPSVTITRGCTTLPIHDYIDVYATVADDRPGVVSELQIDGVRSGPVAPGGMAREWESKTVANGPHVLSVIAHDAAGNETTKSCDITVHNPTVTVDFSSPTDGATVRGVVTLTLDPRADDDPLTGYPMSALGVTISGGGVANGNPNALTRTWDTGLLPDGVYTITANLYWMDYGSPRATKSIQVTVDNPGSVSAPTGVTADEYSTGVRLTWDAVPGATKYRAYRGTTADFTPIGNNLAIETTSLSGTDLRLTPDRYFYKVVAVDGASQNGPATTIDVTHTEDETAPAVTLAAACDGRTLSEYVGPISGTANDDRGGKLYVEVTVDVTRIYGRQLLEGAFQFNWDTRQFADGPHTMRVIAADLWGNETVYDCPWTVDNKALTVPIVLPSSPVAGTVSIGFQPKADGTDVSRPVQLYIDGVQVASTTSGPYTYSWDTTKMANGTHTIEARMFWPPYSTPQATSTETVTVSNSAAPGLVSAARFEGTSST